MLFLEDLLDVTIIDFQSGILAVVQFYDKKLECTLDMRVDEHVAFDRVIQIFTHGDIRSVWQSQTLPSTDGILINLVDPYLRHLANILMACILQEILYLLVLERLIFLVLDINNFHDIKSVIWSEIMLRGFFLVFMFKGVTVLA